MGKKYTKKETDFWGNEKEVHYEDGKKVGETKHRETFWGDKVQDHYDASGDKIGETRKKEGLFGDKAIHYDTDKNQIGFTKDAESLFGDKIERHYDKNGNQVGKSHYNEGIFSGRKKVHDGRYFKAEKHEPKNTLVNTNYDSASYSSEHSSSASYASSSAKSSSNSGVWEFIKGVLIFVAWTGGSWLIKGFCDQLLASFTQYSLIWWLTGAVWLLCWPGIIAGAIVLLVISLGLLVVIWMFKGIAWLIQYFISNLY